MPASRGAGLNSHAPRRPISVIIVPRTPIGFFLQSTVAVERAPVGALFRGALIQRLDDFGAKSSTANNPPTCARTRTSAHGPAFMAPEGWRDCVRL